MIQTECANNIDTWMTKGYWRIGLWHFKVETGCSGGTFCIEAHRGLQHFLFWDWVGPRSYSFWSWLGVPVYSIFHMLRFRGSEFLPHIVIYDFTCIGTALLNILSTSLSSGYLPHFSNHRVRTPSICVIIRKWSFLWIPKGLHVVLL